MDDLVVAPTAHPFECCVERTPEPWLLHWLLHWLLYIQCRTVPARHDESEMSRGYLNPGSWQILDSRLCSAPST